MQLVVTSSNMDHRHHPPTSPIIPVKMKKILLKNGHQQYSHSHCQSETHGRFPSKNKFVEKFPTWNSRINIGFTGVWWVWSSAAAIVVLHFTTLHLHCSTVSTISTVYLQYLRVGDGQSTCVPVTRYMQPAGLLPAVWWHLLVTAVGGRVDTWTLFSSHQELYVGTSHIAISMEMWRSCFLEINAWPQHWLHILGEFLYENIFADKVHLSSRRWNRYSKWIVDIVDK